jgi:Fe(3+) dicitrate transport protein
MKMKTIFNKLFLAALPACVALAATTAAAQPPGDPSPDEADERPTPAPDAPEPDERPTEAPDAPAGAGPEAGPGEEGEGPADTPGTPEGPAPEEPAPADDAPDAPPGPRREAPAPPAAPPPEAEEGVDDADAALDLFDDPDLFRVDELTVIGERPRDLAQLPGAATVVSEEEMRATGAVHANEVLRRVPGVHMLDEEGLGLRLNIGFRGLNPERSRNVLILEDGVPVALAPYGEPEMYYTPRIERMRRLEVVRGSGSILYGPQTIGGVVNFVTLDPPEELTITADTRFGSFNYLMTEASVGATHGKVGYLLYVNHLRNDGHRNFNMQATDVMAKMRIAFTDRSTLRLKLSVYDEQSNSTYLGLTTPQYEANPGFNPAVHDFLPVRRYAASAQHALQITDHVALHTTIYGNQTSRDWRRQAFDRVPVEGRDYERMIDGSGQPIGMGTPFGELPADGSALYFRNLTGNRNRSFTIGGAESRVTADYGSDTVKGRFIGGVRLHYEEAEEQRINGIMPDVSSGALINDETRTGKAIAAYVSNQLTFWDRLRVTPGLRMESLWHTRDVRMVNEVVAPARDTEHTFALIPGIGVSGDVLDPEEDLQVTVFGGIHRGFAPPRTKDAITATGETLELEAEFSWNYEVGTRVGFREWASAEVTAFHLDFSNQIIAPTEAGGAASGSPFGLVNSGRTRHTGVESGVRVDPAEAAGAGFRTPLFLSYTFVRSRFGSGWAEDISNNTLPYAPQHMMSAIARFEHKTGISVQVAGNYIAEQFADLANTVEPSADGLVGRIPSRFLLDARVAYTYAPMGITFYVLAKNLLDERFIASRAPQGIQPGMFRQVIGGIRGQF